MKLLLATKDVNFFSPVFGVGSLEKGTAYFTFGKFARDMASQDAGILMDEHAPVPFLCRDALGDLPKNSRILLIHSGGYGDTITVGILINCLRKKYGADFDVCCHRDKHDFILKPMGFEGTWLSFPPPVGRLHPYDYLLTDLAAMAEDPMDLLRRSPLDVLGEVFGVSLRNEGVQYRIPSEYRISMGLPSSKRIRVGLNFDAMGRVKSYPGDLQDLLISRLLPLNLELHLFGQRTLPSGLAESNGGIHNHVNRTTIPELAALLDQMDLVLSVDSFVAHLSALLGKQTLVLLSTTGEEYFRHYPAVSACSSRLTCAPCFHVNDTCPLGRANCGAFYHESMQTDILASRVIRKISGMYGIKNG
ncbi:MAG: hypothetical protein CVU57_00580 [Deltaproteobacteria bacterium HGW-Deltaproteobacteria-15]|jgi:hypothetical protein|nr:MAG: hypothetical protein CVU57_00580 [Deltaproteobacteria bacterium HGW-Deltaproteobacteria-15]